MLKYIVPLEYIDTIVENFSTIGTNKLILNNNNDFNENMSKIINLRDNKKLDIVFIKTNGNFEKVEINKDLKLPHYMKSFRNIESFYENMDKYITHQDYIKFNLIFEVFEFETENKLVIFTEII